MVDMQLYGWLWSAFGPATRRFRLDSVPVAIVEPVTQRTDTSQWPCPIARTVDELGDGWTMLLLREAMRGKRRFEEFQTGLGIGRNILTNRLARMVERGLFEKVTYSQRPLRHEYRLTDKGTDALPLLLAMAAWGERWLVEGDQPLLPLVHTACDHELTADIVCSHCREPVAARDVRANRGTRT